MVDMVSPLQPVWRPGAHGNPANGVGVVDADYCGPADEIKIQLLNITDAPVQVRRGDRLAQGIVLPCPRIEWEELDEMRVPTRGGFGSTGS
jgi:dUTP pyrophosphatase